MSSESRRAQAEQEFKSTLNDLRQSLPSKIQESLAELSFPSIDDSATIDVQAMQLESAITPLITMMENSRNGKSKSRKVKSIATAWFKASYPSVRLLLSVAQSGSAVILSKLFLLTLRRYRP